MLGSGISRGCIGFGISSWCRAILPVRTGTSIVEKTCLFVQLALAGRLAFLPSTDRVHEHLSQYEPIVTPMPLRFERLLFGEGGG